MKITKVEPLLLDRYLLVQVHTDAGITGLGESGAWGYLEASEAAVQKYGRYLIGKDPLLIEHHWQYMYRFSHFRGAAIMGALSAIDIALWDIAGKHFEVPVYQLLGREGPGPGAGLLSRLRVHARGAGGRGRGRQAAGLHGRRASHAVSRCGARGAVFQDARGQNHRRHWRRAGSIAPRWGTTLICVSRFIGA